MLLQILVSVIQNEFPSGVGTQITKEFVQITSQEAVSLKLLNTEGVSNIVLTLVNQQKSVEIMQYKQRGTFLNFQNRIKMDIISCCLSLLSQ